MKIIITLFLSILFCSAICFADIIYLKDGSVFQGRIITSNEDSIYLQMRTGSTTILRHDIEKIEISDEKLKPKGPKSELHKKIMKSIANDIAQEYFQLKFGPKFGVFSIRDYTLSQYHGTGLLWGGNLCLWIDKFNCIQFEVETYNNKFNGNVPLYDSLGRYLKIASYSDDLSLTPIWLSYLYKFRKSSFVVGPGFGIVVVNRSTLTDGVESSDTGYFGGYELSAGFVTKKAGLIFKYSVVNTDMFWNNINFGGLSILINIYI